MKKYFISALFLSGAILCAGYVLAQEPEISFPVAELGNCESQSECKSYCDKPENMPACLDFADKNNLMSQAELSVARKFVQSGTSGPGGCTGMDACQLYCDDINHIDECITFAEENDLMPPGELEEARKVRAAIKKGVTPPACKNKKDCDAFCSKPENMESCLTFAEAAGFLPEGEIEEAKKMLQAIKKGVKPPNCRGKAECESYCSQESNIEECVAFAEAAGMMDSKELEMFKKTRGKGPGGCRGKEACDKFCETNLEVCIDFAVENGLMDPKDAELTKRTGGKGPGGCRDKEECEAFCGDPANEETCFNFQKEMGFRDDDEVQIIEKDRQMTRELLEKIPEAEECLKNSLGEDLFRKLESGTYFPSREMGEKMGKCFEQSAPREPMGPPPGEMPGPERERPDGYNRPPEGYPVPPEGNQIPPEGYRPPPSGYPQPPEGYQVPPEDYQAPPEGFQSPPPGDYQQMPPSEFPQPPPPESAPAPVPESEPVSVIKEMKALIMNYLRSQ